MELTCTPTYIADEIQKHLHAGGRVQISTYTQSKIYGPKCADMFKTNNHGESFVIEGYRKGQPRWACIATQNFLHVKVQFSKELTS